MAELELGYRDSKETFTIKIDLLNKLKLSEQHNRLIFEGSARSEYRDGKYLRCRLYVSTPVVPDDAIEKALLGSNQSISRSDSEISIVGGRLEISLPVKTLLRESATTVERTLDLAKKGTIERITAESLRQRLEDIRVKMATKITSNSPRQPSISIWFSASIVFNDESKIHVADAFQSFENPRIVSGGRPESNKSKF